MQPRFFYVIQLMLSCELIIPQSCNIKANQVLVLSMLLSTCISIFFEGIILIVHIVLLWIQLIKVAKEHLERVAAGIHFKTERHIGIGIVLVVLRQWLIVVEQYCTKV